MNISVNDTELNYLVLNLLLTIIISKFFIPALDDLYRENRGFLNRLFQTERLQGLLL